MHLKMKRICLKIDKCTCHLSFPKLILNCKAIFNPKLAYINPVLVHRSISLASRAYGLSKKAKSVFCQTHQEQSWWNEVTPKLLS